MSDTTSGISALKQHCETILECLKVYEDQRANEPILDAIASIPNPLKLTQAQTLELFFLGLHTNIKQAISYFSTKYNLSKKNVRIYLSAVRIQASSVLLDKPLPYSTDRQPVDEEDSYVADFPHMDREFSRQLRDQLELEIPMTIEATDDESPIVHEPPVKTRSKSSPLTSTDSHANTVITEKSATGDSEGKKEKSNKDKSRKS